MLLDRRYPIIVLLLVSLLTPMMGWQNPLTQPVGPIDELRMVVPTNQILNPSNRTIVAGERLNDVARNPAGTMFAALTQTAVSFYAVDGKLLSSARLPLLAGMRGLTFSPDGSVVAASLAGCVMLVDVKTATTRNCIATPAGANPAGLSFSPDGKRIYVALNRLNSVGQIDLASGKLVSQTTVGVAPLGLVVANAGKQIFVSNTGGKLSALQGTSGISSGTPLDLDSDGIASGGSVSVIDTATFQVVSEIPVGRHPSGIAASPDGFTVAVADSNSDTVSLIDTQALAVSTTIPVEQIPAGSYGSSPTDVTYSTDGSQLYVTLGGLNAVAAYQMGGDCCKLLGIAATDWYPIAVASAPDTNGAETLFVGNSKGLGARQGSSTYNVRLFQSSVNRIPVSQIGDLSSASAQTATDPFTPGLMAQATPMNLHDLGVQHVFLIVKENRTYDQVLGDVQTGNGDRSLAIYGERITPNLHSLARSYTLFDNYYASGTVSADGHQWVTQAMATSYAERQYSAGWPRSYPYSGEDPLIFAPTGFIWSNVLRHGMTARMFGEFALQSGNYNASWADYLRASIPGTPRIETPSVSAIAAAAGIHSATYPAFNLSVADSYRARLVIDDVANWDAQPENAPNLVIIQLPGDHTVGVTPGAPTPQAMVADNDLAVGRIVESISHSSLWATSAIFIVEDDAQDGVDHVDGHRTTCYIASPFAKRGGVDSINYNHTSVVRTIEDLLGLPTMNRFDATAVPMSASFTTQADTTPFDAIAPNVPLDQLTPQLSALTGAARSAALASMKMNFRSPDAAPEMKLNKILWQQAKGWNAKYPKPPHKKTCPKDAD